MNQMFVCPINECVFSSHCDRHQKYQDNPDYTDHVVLSADPRKDNGYCHIYIPTNLTEQE
jgi:hypothetical protein